MTEKTILTLALIFIFGAPLYSLGYISLSNVSIFGFSLAALLMSIFSLLDNPLKQDQEQNIIRKITKDICFILSLALLILSLMIKENLPYVKEIVNSVDANIFLLFSIGIAFLTLFLGDNYKKQFFRKMEIEKNKAVSEALRKYNSHLEDLEKRLNDKNK